MNLKEAVFKQCLAMLNEKIGLVQATLNDLKQSAANETKSTAGDKHETALAMLQIEQENSGRQLQTLLQQRLQLTQINLAVGADKVVPGSLVKTDNGWVFIGVGLGKIKADGYDVFAVSTKSPLGISLLGCMVNQSVQVNRLPYLIIDIQ